MDNFKYIVQKSKKSFLNIILKKELPLITIIYKYTTDSSVINQLKCLRMESVQER